jgi:hypothetical protein
MCRHIWACVSRIICGFEARGRIRPIDRAKLRRLSWTFSICVHPCLIVSSDALLARHVGRGRLKIQNTDTRR